jgi:hypothetical protein
VPNPSRSLQRTIDIDAPPDHVWKVVSDLRRTGEWSPECRKVLVLGGGAVRQGSRIVGFNRRRWILWPTTSQVRLFEPGQAVGWTVFENGTTWSYRLEPRGAGTRLTERRDAPDGITTFADRFAQVFLGGSEPHSAELEDGMQASLERIRDLVEREAARDGTRPNG